MKIKYRRPDKSNYSTRAARAEAKKLILGMLADEIRDSAICGYEQATIDAERFADRITHREHNWQHGIRKQLDAAAMELLDEFRRRSGKP